MSSPAARGVTSNSGEGLALQVAERAIARRVATIAFARSLLEASAVTLALLAVGMLLARVLAHGVLRLDPRWAWLLLGALAWAGWRAWRERPGAEACALYLDRRLGLHGLAVAAHEREPGAWEPALEAALRETSAALPRYRPWRALGRLALAAALLAAVQLLPPPAQARAPVPTAAVAATLEQLAERLREAEQQRRIDAQTARELEQRLERMRRRLEQNAPPRWSDLDAVAERIAQAERRMRDRRRQLATELDALARALRQGAESGGSGSGAREAGAAEAGAGRERESGDGARAGETGGEAGATRERDGEEGESGRAREEALAEALEALERSLREAQAQGVLPELPPELARQLDELLSRAGGQAAPGGAAPPLDPQQLAEAIERLRELLEQGAELQGQPGSCPAGVSSTAIPVPGAGQAGGEGEGRGSPSLSDGNQPGAGGVKGGPGSGGVARGPGSAPLEDWLGVEDPDRPQGALLPLPRGALPPRGGQTLWRGRGEPHARPEQPQGPGHAAQRGAGVRASRYERLSPRQREVLRRFFGASAPR